MPIDRRTVLYGRRMKRIATILAMTAFLASCAGGSTGSAKPASSVAVEVPADGMFCADLVGMNASVALLEAPCIDDVTGSEMIAGVGYAECADGRMLFAARAEDQSSAARAE